MHLVYTFSSLGNSSIGTSVPYILLQTVIECLLHIVMYECYCSSLYIGSCCCFCCNYYIFVFVIGSNCFLLILFIMADYSVDFDYTVCAVQHL